jgi:hypothetical protein
LKNRLGTSVGLAESDISLSHKEITQMGMRKPNGKRDRDQGRNGAGQSDEPRPTAITPGTPYGGCSERLTPFGGLLALVKFLDLIGFEHALEEHDGHPKRATPLGAEWSWGCCCAVHWVSTPPGIVQSASLLRRTAGTASTFRIGVERRRVRSI